MMRIDSKCHRRLTLFFVLKNLFWHFDRAEHASIVNDQKFVLVDLVCRVLWSVTRTAGSFQNWFDPSDDQKSKTSFKIPRSFLNISPHERFNEHLLRWITQLSQTHPLFHGLLRFYWALLRRYQWFGFHTSGKIMKLGLSRQNQKERRTPVGSEMICY